MPRLTVLMPAYNAEATIQSAVRTTLRNLPQDSELMVLDDGSTDRTAAIVDAIGDSRVRLRSRPNAGVAASLNEMLSATDSEFIARMDADDIVLQGRFKRQLKAIGGNAVGSSCDAIFTTVVSLGTWEQTIPRISRIGSDTFGYHLLLTNPVAHSTLMARRSAINNVGGYRNIPSEDYDLWLRLTFNGSKLRRMALPGVGYRVHPGQVTASDEWRRSSWQDPSIGSAYAALAETLTGEASARITSLSIDDSLTATEKQEQFDSFAHRFERAVQGLDQIAKRVLLRKLAERRTWFQKQVGEDRDGNAAVVYNTHASRVNDSSNEKSASPISTVITPRERLRSVNVADRKANAHYPKSRFVLHWFRAAQRWREGRGPISRAMFLMVGGSYKLVTEGCMGIELPISTNVGPGLRLRHGFGIVVNPASRIGANVMLRQGVTLGNRKAHDDCPVIEDGVEIGVGAVIIGAVTIGADAKIGPNAVVFTDVPAGSVVYSPTNYSRANEKSL